MNELPKDLSEGVLNVRFEDLSEKNIRLSKDKLIDNIGNLAGGALAYGNREVLRVIQSFEEKQEAPVFFLNAKASLGNAAMINTLSARSNDYEPMNMNIDGLQLPSKESATLINAALTAGAVYGFSGKDYITHEVVGEDLSVRIIYAGGPWCFEIGWGSDFTMPIYGVCAQLARIRGLDAQQLRDAWGMGMNMCAGTMSNYYDHCTSVKLGAGYNIRNADFCTRLAAEGFSSLKNIFEGPRNIYSQYRGMAEACNPEMLRKDFGKKFYMEESIKLFPVGSPATIAAFAGNDLYGIVSTERIREIELAFPEGYDEMYYWPPYEVGRDPLTNAQFSYQYALCAPLLMGPFKIKHYSEESLRNTELLRLCGITNLCHDSTLPEDPSTVRVTLTLDNGEKITRYKDNSSYDLYRDYPTREQLLAKYWDQVEAYGLISKSKAEKCIELVDKLEDLKDIRELTELLSV